MKNGLSSLKVSNIVLCVIILLIFAFIIGKRTNAATFADSSSEVIPLKKQLESNYPDLLSNFKFNNNKEEKEEELDLNYYLEEYKETIKFFSKLFDYEYEDIINNLILRNDEEFILTNIGNLKDKEGNKEEYINFEYGLIEYFYHLNDTKELKRNVIYRPYLGESDYVEDLIIYFSSIYENVDSITLLSIGAAESGYYKVSYMLNRNNVYGGMSCSKLIAYNNIEQGILSYVRLMSKYYYGKGLTTLHEIGRVYCPVFENGIKIASPHWIDLVTRAQDYYAESTQEIKIENLIEKEKQV